MELHIYLLLVNKTIANEHKRRYPKSLAAYYYFLMLYSLLSQAPSPHLTHIQLKLAGCVVLDYNHTGCTPSQWSKLFIAAVVYTGQHLVYLSPMTPPYTLCLLTRCVYMNKSPFDYDLLVFVYLMMKLVVNHKHNKVQ